MTTPLDDLKRVVAELEFAHLVTLCLARLRLATESREATLERVLALAESAVCRICRGYGHGFSEATCSACSGTGARPRQEREP